MPELQTGRKPNYGSFVCCWYTDEDWYCIPHLYRAMAHYHYPGDFVRLKEPISEAEQALRSIPAFPTRRLASCTPPAPTFRVRSRWARATCCSSSFGKDGRPAPQLSGMRLSPAVAEALLEQALRNIEVMLACHVVHGDLSAYNMLYAGRNLRVMALPQAVDARSNANACALLTRDIANVCDYFASQGADAEPVSFAAELWDLYAHAKL